MDALALLDKFYPPGSPAREILMTHSRQVADKSLELARRLPEAGLDLDFIEAAALLHDIGIFMTRCPDIGCTGEAPYICHGYLGRELLDREGLDPAFGRVAERHTGAGITAELIRRHTLPLPLRDMVPETLAEEIICCADKFFSKSPARQHHCATIPEILTELTAIDPEHGHRFARWVRQFGISD